MDRETKHIDKYLSRHFHIKDETVYKNETIANYGNIVGELIDVFGFSNSSTEYSLNKWLIKCGIDYVEYKETVHLGMKSRYISPGVYTQELDESGFCFSGSTDSVGVFMTASTETFIMDMP